MYDIYYNQRHTADTFNPQIIEILKKTFKTEDVKISDVYSDRHRATDFIVQSENKILNIGARIRTFEMLLKYPNEFTIRKDTEIDKIRLGCVDYSIYGFSDPFNSKIIQYRILDMKVFRHAIEKVENLKSIPNADNLSHPFYAFNINEFPKKLVIEEIILNDLELHAYEVTYAAYRNKKDNEMKKRIKLLL